MSYETTSQDFGISFVVINEVPSPGNMSSPVNIGKPFKKRSGDVLDDFT
jgi:hypothetical protein